MAKVGVLEDVAAMEALASGLDAGNGDVYVDVDSEAGDVKGKWVSVRVHVQ